MSKETHLSRDEDTIIRLPPARHAQWFISGWSIVVSSYANDYGSELLTGVMSDTELMDVVASINEKLQSFWPCAPVMMCGICCCPCTLGASLIFPHYCLSQSESQTNDLISNINLRGKFHQRDIRFAIVKGLCSNHLELRFPSKLRPTSDTREHCIDLESNFNAALEITTTQPLDMFAYESNKRGSIKRNDKVEEDSSKRLKDS